MAQAGNQSAHARDKPFPVPTIQGSALIAGLSTDMVFSSFQDCSFLVITQLGKLGTMVRSLLATALIVSCSIVQWPRRHYQALAMSALR